MDDLHIFNIIFWQCRCHIIHISAENAETGKNKENATVKKFTIRSNPFLPFALTIGVLCNIIN